MKLYKTVSADKSYTPLFSSRENAEKHIEAASWLDLEIVEIEIPIDEILDSLNARGISFE